MYLLDLVGLADAARKLPSSVSGGQQQLAAIARALANDPPILAADEPTGNLDSATAEIIFQLFNQLVDQGKTILMVTHDPDKAQRVTRVVTIADGEIQKKTTESARGNLPSTSPSQREGDRLLLPLGGDLEGAMSIKPRWKKVFADLWGNKSRTVLVVLSIAIGVFAVGMVANAYLILDRASTVGYEAVNPTSAFIVAASFDDDLVDTIRAMPEVAEAEGRRVRAVRMFLNGRWYATALSAQDYENGRVNLLETDWRQSHSRRPRTAYRPNGRCPD